MITTAIIGNLSSTTLPNFANNINKVKTTKDKTKISTILKDAQSEYKLDGQLITAKDQAKGNVTDNLTDTPTDSSTTNDDRLTITAAADPSADGDGGDATLVTAKADRTAINECVNQLKTKSKDGNHQNNH